MNKQNNPDMVICPACVHEFPGIPENVQAELARLRASEAQSLNDWQNIRAEVERLRTALRVVLAARPSLTEKGWQIVQDAFGEVGKKEAEMPGEEK